ncbi:Trans-L-3-hydroxyproline dehydratase [Mizuhopecten yessoensis]|uniref:trans-L-3-hydroxyproline dehydratase n=1 Tax=Mizuhopecten yessoensis TaxID=6573 RepID=A0A210Q9N7_MIZYE|nr:Trans-L-3-hydroxyproline dehydratase [Mizuhopecten yessoensis]
MKNMAEIPDNVEIRTREMHTAGEPLRVVESGFPSPRGDTILDKIRYTREHLDPYRKLLMYEPRGHYDMYGALLVPADNKDADIATIFMHNEGYSTMCGHAVVALGRYAVDTGLVRNPSSLETRVAIQCPCGLVEAFVEYKDGKTGNVRFNSVPAFVFATDVTVDVPGYGHVTVDIVYGGSFYAFVADSQYNFRLEEASIQDVRNAAGATTDALRKQLKLSHPESDDLAFLFGTIVTDGQDGQDGCSDTPSSNVCVFAERQIDRSPCGSGGTARIARQYHKEYIKLGQAKQFMGPSKAKFTAKAIKEVTYGGYKAVVVEVSGKGYYCGSSEFSVEEDDVIGRGFLL